jgi:membrane carboxypeptidase/penicillin-binding protein
MKKRSLSGHKFGFNLVLGLAFFGLGYLIAIKFLLAVTISPAIIDLAQDDARWVSFYNHQQKKIVKVFIREQSKIPISQMPTILQKAFVRRKDPDFYGRNRRLADLPELFVTEVKAFLKLTTLNHYDRDIAATIAHNLFLIRKKTLPRRLDEAILAYKIERKYRKEEILESYLNNIYFGEGTFGVEAASKYYFGKNTIKLQPHEIAFLICLATDTLSPHIYKKEQLLHNQTSIKKYRDLVLDEMVKGDLITPKQAAEYKRKPLGIVNH